MEETRVQEINGDTVVEITEQQPVKIRISENALLRRRDYLTASIARFQSELSTTELALANFYEKAGIQ